MAARIRRTAGFLDQASRQDGDGEAAAVGAAETDGAADPDGGGEVGVADPEAAGEPLAPAVDDADADGATLAGALADGLGAGEGVAVRNPPRPPSKP